MSTTNSQTETNTMLGAVNTPIAPMQWNDYKKVKPNIGDLVLAYRDIESRQMYVVHWSDEDDRYADWNEVTHWCKIEYPY